MINLVVILFVTIYLLTLKWFLTNSLETSTTDISPVGNEEDIRTIGNYIRLDNEMPPKLSEILETFKEDITTTSSVVGTDTTGQVHHFHLDNKILPKQSDVLKTYRVSPKKW